MHTEPQPNVDTQPEFQCLPCQVSQISPLFTTTARNKSSPKREQTLPFCEDLGLFRILVYRRRAQLLHINSVCSLQRLCNLKQISLNTCYMYATVPGISGQTAAGTEKSVISFFHNLINNTYG